MSFCIGDRIVTCFSDERCNEKYKDQHGTVIATPESGRDFSMTYVTMDDPSLHDRPYPNSPYAGLVGALRQCCMFHTRDLKLEPIYLIEEMPS